MKRQKTFRIDKLFGLATLICLLAIALMVYNDFFRTTTGTGNETETQSRTSGYLNDNKNIESKGASSKAVVLMRQEEVRIPDSGHQERKKKTLILI